MLRRLGTIVHEEQLKRVGLFNLEEMRFRECVNLSLNS